MTTSSRTRRPGETPDGDAPRFDPQRGRTRERPAVTKEVLRRAALRDSAEHNVLRNIARTYARYYGPQVDESGE